ncbi:MAG: 3-oxoacyl-(acyl-carrier-protein) reductase FabG [Planctomycetes bacterium ADurb.Bin126]|nr:MAG: 3-oxoacyl-(acyl-carrier-protein) reductase FabG [Planctomycetes bacterium ADurb.Bin126]HOD82671.1 3-oxoacyl-ACP reductase family protein [Phycisphaerae bacterium]HQL73834.1 3-oxoacyl-ACP reductase family protein [Phycisphaerae bacterium]
MDLNLKDKVVLVTGGSRGLGRTICESFADEGAKIVVSYYRQANGTVNLADEAEAVVADLQRRGSAAMAVGGDVSIEQDVADLFEQAWRQLGPVDVLVNNAGICPVSFIKDMPYEMWRSTIDINLNGTFLCSRELVRRATAQKRPARIVNIVSQAAFNGSATGKSHYSASKAGIVMLTVSLAKEMAREGITVNAVAPGMMRTEMVAESLKVKEEQYNKSIPLGRIGDTREVANVVLFLASDAASYVTGATYDASGGMLMR